MSSSRKVSRAEREKEASWDFADVLCSINFLRTDLYTW